jgi:Tol biopolymer transport system component/DNA-binding winged helix-turn-helix (wHTH) protein
MRAPGTQARHETVRFGEFEADFSRQILSIKSVRIKLQNQPFQVLELLIRRAPDVVSRDEIRLHVWGDDIHIDATQSIHFCIRQIRSALSDTSSEPRFIETLPKQGYRFIAQLEAVRVTPIPVGVPRSQSSQLTVKRRQPVVWSLAALIATVLIGVFVGRLVKRDTISGVARISPVTTYPGNEREPSLSPDGRQVAFSWEGEGGDNRDIYVVPLGEQHPLRLTSAPEEDAYPAWSPDGKHIAFIRHYGGTRADIMLISALGGPERKLREIRLNPWMRERTLAWSPDGKWLCFTNEIGASANHVLSFLSVATGAVRQLSSGHDLGVGDFSPAFSPDGRWLAFSRFTDPNNSELRLQRLSPDLTPQGSPLIVEGAGIHPKAPVWTPDGRQVLFLDRSRIMRTNLGSAAQPFYVSSTAFSELTLAAAEPRLLASLQNQQTEIWTIPLAAQGLKSAGPARRIVPSSAGEGAPRFSPDGRWLAFSSTRTGDSEIWLANADGTNPRQLSHLAAYIAGFPRWSRDSRFLTFHARIPTYPQIYVIRIADGMLTQITNSKPGFAQPSWSSDGSTLYGAALQDDDMEIYRIPVTGGAPKRLWNGAEPVEAPGHGMLLYTKEDSRGVFGRSISANPAQEHERVFVADYQPPWGGFYPVSDGIYYVACAPNGVARAFSFYSLQTGGSVDIAPAPPNLGVGLSVTPDRSRLAYSTKARDGEDIVLIELK